MAQQMVNGSYYDGDITITNRMTDKNAVVNAPLCGKHKKPQDVASLRKRKSQNAVKAKTIKNGALMK